MSFTSGQRQFTLGLYGQAPIVMDWFGLTDPFSQQLPLKISNQYSGTLWIQGQLVNPPSGYYSYSGISLGSVNSGSNATLPMTWSRGVSGWIVSSSPVSDNLTLGLIAFTSSNYTGPVDSGTLSFTNFHFNRYSGMLRLYGDDYSNDQPTPSVTEAAGGTLSGTYRYAVSYIRSGWESDIGSPSTSFTLNSGFGTFAVSWGSVQGVTQYCLWRWSGSSDFTLYSGNGPTDGGYLRRMDLVYASNQLSLTDNGVAALVSNMNRHRTWQMYRAVADGSVAATTSVVYFSSPQARQFNDAGVGVRMTHGYYLNRNLSGTTLSGVAYFTIHLRQPASASGNNNALGIARSLNNDGSLSGEFFLDPAALANLAGATWYRLPFAVSGQSSSGVVHIQVFNNSVTNNIDDVFVVLAS